MNISLEYFILRIPVVLFALTIHECAHGWVAYRLGDRTAYDAGRITMNPLTHLDPFGTLMLLFGPFGWAKPVPVDSRYFKNQRQGILLVSAAGPVSNILLALLFGYIFRFSEIFYPGMPPQGYLANFFRLAIYINAGIAFFNLLPIPPLDGSKIVLSLLPDSVIPDYLRMTRYIPPIFLSLLILEWVVHRPVLSLVINPLFMPFYQFILHLINWRF